MFSKQNTLAKVDPELWQAIEAENRRQEDHIELIASENYVSAAVMEAQGSQLTNKYAEGYPGKRYYGGCEFVDLAEQLAIDRLKTLFGAEAANVQPNSSSQANQAVLMAFAKPGDTILDTHGGSGSSVIACLDMGYSITWIEKDEDYYNAALKRIKDFAAQPKLPLDDTPEPVEQWLGFEEAL